MGEEGITWAYVTYEPIMDGEETFPARVSRVLKSAIWSGNSRSCGAGATTYCSLVRLCGRPGRAALLGLLKLELPATVQPHVEVVPADDDSGLSLWIADRKAQVVRWNPYRKPFGYSWV
jgi:hypothetical protein